jgi:hypothetical protein
LGFEVSDLGFCVDGLRLMHVWILNDFSGEQPNESGLLASFSKFSTGAATRAAAAFHSPSSYCSSSPF